MHGFLIACSMIPLWGLIAITSPYMALCGIVYGMSTVVWVYTVLYSEHKDY